MKNSMTVYKISNNVVLEPFEDGGLVLILPERRLVELNTTAVDIINLMNGERTLAQVASELINSHDISEETRFEQVYSDILSLTLELSQTGILEIISKID
jgi:hypothetical protein